MKYHDVFPNGDLCNHNGLFKKNDSSPILVWEVPSYYLNLLLWNNPVAYSTVRARRQKCGPDAEQVLECRASQNSSFLGMARDWDLSQVYQLGVHIPQWSLPSSFYGKNIDTNRETNKTSSSSM